MTEFIFQLKSVIIVILVSEFLKELLATERFQKYIQFAVSLFLLGFLLSLFSNKTISFQNSVSFPVALEQENLLPEEYETKIGQSIEQKLSDNGILVSDITVTLSDAYEIEQIRITTNESEDRIHTVLEGDFPYEVVPPSE